MKKINCLLFLALSFYTHSSFGVSTLFSEEEDRLAQELLTPEQIQFGRYWYFSLRVSEFTLLGIKFYDNPNLSGEVVAEIDSKGLRYKNEYTCQLERVWEETPSGEYKNQPISYADILTSKTPAKKFYGFENFGLKILNLMREEKYFICENMYIFDRDGDRITEGLRSYGFVLPVVNKMAGEIMVKGKKLYFDVRPWIQKYSLINDVQTELEMTYSEKELNDLHIYIKSFREVINTGSTLDIYNFIKSKKDKFCNLEKNKRKYGCEKGSLTFLESDKNLLKLELTPEIRKDFLRATMAKYANGNVVNVFSIDYIRSKEYADLGGYFTRSLTILYNDGDWTITYFDGRKKFRRQNPNWGDDSGI